MTKTFHSYSNDDLKICCKESLNDEYTFDNYYVLYEIKDRNCGLSTLRLYVFKNKYDALNYFYTYIREWSDEFKDLEYGEMCKKIDTALYSIEKNRTDIDISLGFLGFSSDSLCFDILEEGYWDRSLDLIKNIQNILYYEVDYLEDIKDCEGNNEDGNDSYDKIEKIKEILRICEILLTPDFTTSEKSLLEFRSLCMLFNEYFNLIEC